MQVDQIYMDQKYLENFVHKHDVLHHRNPRLDCSEINYKRAHKLLIQELKRK